MSNNTELSTLLATVLESKGITPESLLGKADLTRLLAQAEQVPTTEATQEATMSIPTNSITIKGVVVPAPVKGQPITKEIKAAYNSALSRTGNGTLGSGGATYDNLLAKFTLLSGVADSPAVAANTTQPVQNASLAETLAKLLGGNAPQATPQAAAPKPEQPTTLREAISTYQPLPKTRVWIKADGTRVPCTEKQYQMWSKRRNELQDTTPVTTQVVEPLVPADVDVNAIAAAFVQALLGTSQG